MPAACPCRKKYLARSELEEAPRPRLQSGRHGHAISFFTCANCSDGVERRDSIGKRAPAHPAPGGTLRPYSARSGTRLRLLSVCLAFQARLPAGSGRETPARLLTVLLRRDSAAGSALRGRSRVPNAQATRLHRTRWLHPVASRPANGGWRLPFRPAVPCAGKNTPTPPSNARAGCWPQSLSCTLLPRRCCPAFLLRARKCNWPAPGPAWLHNRLAV